MRRTSTGVLIGLLAWCAGACSGLAELHPAEDATRVREGAYATAESVTVRAEGDEWPGLIEVREYVTPVHVAIINASERPVRVDFGRLRLEARNRSFSAIAPEDVRGTIWVPDPPRYYATLPDNVTPPPRTGFEFGYDDIYDRSPTGQLPTADLLDLGLRPGVLQPGATRSGFVYFQRVPTSEKRVELTFDLLTAEGVPAGTIRIPFDVR
jgi:hypothetical protein